MLLWPSLVPGSIPRPLACLSSGSLCAGWCESCLVVGSVGLRFFFDPGCQGRPLWPAYSGGPVGPIPCFPGSGRFICGPLALLVLCLCFPTVLAGLAHI